VRDILLAFSRQKLFRQQQDGNRRQAGKTTDAQGANSPELLEPQISRGQVLPDFVLYNAARWLRDFGGLQALAERPLSSGSEEDDRLLLRLGIGPLEARWERNANARLGLDDAFEDPDGSYNWPYWKSHPLVQAERILISAALITLLLNTCCMAWASGYLWGRQKDSVVHG
jgi:hypothetical protein